jgi:hypothetical protein
MSLKRAAFEAVSDYVIVVDELYGHYIDSVFGFSANAQRLVASQETARACLPADLDQDVLAVRYSQQGQNDPNAKIQHVTSQGEYRERNQKGGRNHQRAAQILIVLLFTYWEQQHRATISQAMGLGDGQLRVPIMGDLRRLRNDILKKRGFVAAETVRSLEFIRGIEPERFLSLTANDMEHLIDDLKAALGKLLDQAFLTEPGKGVPPATG